MDSTPCKLPTVSTGTTCAIIKYKGGHLLAADRRASMGLHFAWDIDKIFTSNEDDDGNSQMAYTGAGNADALVRGSRTIWGAYFRRYQSIRGIRLCQLRSESEVAKYMNEYIEYLLDSRKIAAHTGLPSGTIFLLLARYRGGVVPLICLFGTIISPVSQLRLPKTTTRGSRSYYVSGSGEPYLNGDLFKYDKAKSLSERPLEEIKKIVREGFVSSTSLDFYSNPGQKDNSPAGADQIDVVYINEGDINYIREKLQLF